MGGSNIPRLNEVFPKLLAFLVKIVGNFPMVLREWEAIA
jgi:hypothetical protein